jgi:3-oxoacyl-[acyl-carrier protein] reductase
MIQDSFVDSQNFPDDFQIVKLEKTHYLKIRHSQDIANMTLFLASDQASYITGAVISVDGGRVLL